MSLLSLLGGVFFRAVLTRGGRPPGPLDPTRCARAGADQEIVVPEAPIDADAGQAAPGSRFQVHFGIAHVEGIRGGHAQAVQGQADHVRRWFAAPFRTHAQGAVEAAREEGVRQLPHFAVALVGHDGQAQSRARSRRRSSGIPA